MPFTDMLKPITDRLDGLEIHEEAKREIIIDIATIQQELVKNIISLRKMMIFLAIFSLVFPLVLRFLIK